MTRIRAVSGVLVTLLAEAVLLAVLYKAAPALGTVDFSHPAVWVRSVQPATAVTAMARLGGMIISGWLLVSTVIYALASAAGAERLRRRSAWVTLPMVRRLVDGFAAASIVASSAAALAATASATPVAHPQPVRPVRTPQPARQGAYDVSDERPAATAAPVADRAVRRHLPHPGRIDHAADHPQLAAASTGPAESGEFAGLRPGTKVVVVQPGDCLSVLAQQHLGDWRLDHQIFELNVGRAQPDGRPLTAEHWVYPGQVLVMPDHAVGTQVVPGHRAGASRHETTTPETRTPAPAGHIHRAAKPDSSAVAHGSAGRTDHAEPRSTDPDRAPAKPARRSLRSAVGHHSAGRGERRTFPASAASRASSTPLTASGRADTPGQTVAADQHMAWPLPAELLAGGLMAAGFVGLLTKLHVARRPHRAANGERRRRLTGRQARVELAARVGADFDTAGLVDAAQRRLAVCLAEDPVPGPAVLAAIVDDTAIRFLLSEPVQAAPAGLVVDEGAWKLDRPGDLDEWGDLAEVEPPLPALVSVGRTDRGELVLLNLAATGRVRITGDQRTAAEIAASVAVELATSSWSQLQRLLLVGFGRVDGLGVAGPVELVDSLDHALPSLRATAMNARSSTGDAVSADHARLVGVGEAHDLAPTVVIGLDRAVLDSDPLSELTSDPAAGVYLLARDPIGDPGHGWVLEADDAGLLDLEPLGITVRAKRLPLPLLELMEERLAVAADPDATVPAAPPGSEVPDDDGDWWPLDADPAHRVETDPAASDVTTGVDTADPDDPGDAAGSDGSHQQSGAGKDLVEPAPADTDTTTVEAPASDGPAEENQPGATTRDGGESESSAHRLEPAAAAGAATVAAPGSSLGQIHPLRTLLPDIPEVGWGGDRPHVLVRLLGASPKVLRLGPDGEVDEIDFRPRARSLEVIALLAVHPDGMSRARLATTIYPEKRLAPKDVTFNSDVSFARKALGVSPQGVQYLPTVKSGLYQLAPTVALDLHVLDRLLAAAEQPMEPDARIGLLSAALSLAGDEPPLHTIRAERDLRRRSGKTAGSQKHWRWFDIEEEAGRRAEEQIFAAAAGLASLHLTASNWLEASRAARRGLAILPLDPELWTIRFDAERARGLHHLVAANDEYQQTRESEGEPYYRDAEVEEHYARLVGSS